MKQLLSERSKRFAWDLSLLATGIIIGFTQTNYSSRLEEGHNLLNKAATLEKRRVRPDAGIDHASLRLAAYVSQSRAAEIRSVTEWAEFLARTPEWMLGRDAFRGEVNRFLSIHKAKGVSDLLAAGLSGERVAIAIASQEPAAIPSMMAAIVADPTKIGRDDIEQIVFDALKAGPFVKDSLQPVIEHIRQYFCNDESLLRKTASLLGRDSFQSLPDFMEILTEEQKETASMAAIKSHAMGMKPGEQLTQALENNIVGTANLIAAFESISYLKGAHGDPNEMIAWISSLNGLKRDAALKGWVVAQQDDDQPAVTPLKQLLNQTGALDSELFTKAVQYAMPFLLK